MKKKVGKEPLSKGAASGMVALVFLVLGFQLALFVVKVVERCPVDPGMTGVVEPGMTEAVRPGTMDSAASPPAPTTSSPSAPTGGPEQPRKTKLGGYPRPSSRAEAPKRTVESFPFNPNTVTLEELQRLGLTERQAESIDNYRSKGGRFRSKADFQKMYVVSDSLFARLEPYIEIPKIELNAADSTALVSLRGIGPWYARKILVYRDRLGGFVAREQLLEIDGIDAERFAGFADDITVDPSRIRRLDLWHASDSILSRHPYLGPKGARSLVRYRELYDSTRWTLPDLAQERVLSKENIEKLKKYIVIQ
ncbi:MAG: helix-hairpin-helix domain-containing protein [Bacteroidales bacterium]|nr:helix-hairpin-helix domain-containing protein [Bacteroidales bacterium]